MRYWRTAVKTELQTLIEKPRLGLVTDMDGTISPIVGNPAEARVTSRSRAALRGLQSRLTLVAVVSGRAVEDVQSRVAVPGLVYIGNHGLERWTGDAVEVTPEVADYRPALEAAATALRAYLVDGMFIEDKIASLSVHYRQTANPEAFVREFAPLAKAISAKHGLKVFQGRMIFELRPPINIDKGTTFARLAEEYALDGAVFVGDDTTDVDALLMTRRLRERGQCYALGIGVESDDMPAPVRASADLLALGISDVEDFLDWLLMACSASPT